MTMIQFLGEWMVRSSVLILTGTLLLWLLRVKNPSVRLAAWTAMLAGSLAIPLLTAALPNVPLPVMRAPAAASGLTGERGAILPMTQIPGLTSTSAPPRFPAWDRPGTTGCAAFRNFPISQASTGFAPAIRFPRSV